MSWQEYMNNPLWSILVETVHAMVMYPHHKAYTRDVALHEQPDIKPTDLAAKVGIPLARLSLSFMNWKKRKAKVSHD